MMQRDAVVDRGRYLVPREQEAPVARDRDDRQVAPRVLHAERSGIAPAKAVLVAGRDEGARPVDRKQEPGRKADLRHLVDENAVLGQFGADGVEKADLGPELGKPLTHLRLPLDHLFTPGRPGALMRGEHVDEAAQDRFGIADERAGRPAKP